MRNEAIIGDPVQIHDRPQLLVTVGERRQHAGIARKMARGNEAVCVVLAKKAEGRRAARHQPARRASTRRRTFCMAGSPPRIMYASGVWPAKIGLPFGSCTHWSARTSECRICSAL